MRRSTSCRDPFTGAPTVVPSSSRSPTSDASRDGLCRSASMESSHSPRTRSISFGAKGGSRATSASNDSAGFRSSSQRRHAETERSLAQRSPRWPCRPTRSLRRAASALFFFVPSVMSRAVNAARPLLPDGSLPAPPRAHEGHRHDTGRPSSRRTRDRPFGSSSTATGGYSSAASVPERGCAVRHASGSGNSAAGAGAEAG